MLQLLESAAATSHSARSASTATARQSVSSNDPGASSADCSSRRCEELLAFVALMSPKQKQRLSRELGPVLIAATSGGLGTPQRVLANEPPTASSLTAPGATGGRGGAVTLPLLLDVETTGKYIRDHRVVDVCILDPDTGA